LKKEVEGRWVLTDPGAPRPPLFSPVGASAAAPRCSAVFLRDPLPGFLPE